MYVDPQALVAAAMELESAATRLRGIVSTAQPTLRVLPAGSEEVSGSAANYF
ncbi:PE family protein, partial [Streptomyces sp. NPDC050698]